MQTMTLHKFEHQLEGVVLQRQFRVSTSGLDFCLEAPEPADVSGTSHEAWFNPAKKKT